MAAIKPYIGQGIKFPLQLDNGSPVLATNEELLSQSIAEYLSTPVNTRFFLGEVGSRIREHLFEPNDEVLYDMLRFHIAECIRQWERRVEFLNVNFTRSDQENLLLCEVTCRDTQEDLPFTFVYPYYRQLKH